MPLLAVDHVQLAMPRGREAEAIAFYQDLLGIPQKKKPPILEVRGGCWFESATLKVHLGVEEDFRPAIKAHPAFLVEDLAQLSEAIVRAGYRTAEDEPLEGYERIFAFDPFGNRIELLEPHVPAVTRGDAR